MSKGEMLDAIKAYLNIKTNKAFADFLGISSQAVSNWYTRNTFDAELIYTKCLSINPAWLLTGEGEMLIKKEETIQQTSSKQEDFIYKMYQEKEKQVQKLTEELRAMERKVGSLEAELRHAATLSNRTADSASTKKHSSQSRASAHSASVPSNE